MLLGEELDKCVQDYLKDLMEVGGISAANGIISAQNCTLPLENDGHISITKGWDN